MSRAIVLLAAGAILLGAPLASAAPSRWAKARHPELEQRESLLAEADALVAKYRHARHVQKDGDGMAAARIYLEKARDLLAEGGAERSRDPTLRYRLAQLQHLLGDDEKALPLLEVLLRDNPPAPIRALAYGDLAVCYARLGRHEDEIKAYGEALKLTPYSTQRATLLANRAEAYMALGDITAAIEGYRASLSGLSSIDMLRGYGVTTLWGLGIALDRSGDLDAGIEALRLARTYDPLDKLIKNENSWFFDPPHDKYYYRAIGHWSAARAADLGAAQAEHYAQAIGALEEYIASAPTEDPWLPMARVRLRQCEKERDIRLRSAKRKTAPAPRPASGKGLQ